MRFKLVVAAGLVVAALAVYTGFLVKRHRAETYPSVSREGKAGMPIRTDKARVVTLKEVIGASGEVSPIGFAKLTAMVSSRVESVNGDLGDIVRAGQVLVRFDAGIHEAMLSSARSAAEKARSAEQNARVALERMTALYEKRLVARSEVEDVQGRLDTARADRASSLAALAVAEKGIGDTVVRSPMTGVVKERNVNPGETPQVHGALFTIGIIDHVAFIARMAEEKVAVIRPGQAAEVAFDSFPNMVFAGTVVKIDPTTDPKSRTFLVHIRIANRDLLLKPGLSGFARIEDRRTVLAVPSVAVINPLKEGASVFTVDSGLTAHLRAVRVASSAEGFTEVAGGLEEGEEVVVVGHANLRDGDRVRIGDEYAEGAPADGD
jgi:RND family efflux transporter MFP subunit